MASLPHFSETDIRRWVGEPSFARSRSYVGGAILRPRRTATRLKAECVGSAPQPYHVEAILNEDGIAAAACSCPVGAGGRCKHVAALLQTWLADPDLFLKVEELDTALERRSKAELIALIRRMVERYPDLELLLELPLPEGTADAPVDLATIRRQVAHAFSGYDEYWGGTSASTVELDQLLDLADGYAARDNWRSALAIYQNVAEGVLEHYGMVHDEEGGLTAVVSRCAMGLGDVLASTADPVEREAILHALFEIYRHDIDYGGVGLGDQAYDMLVQHIEPEERQLVVRWIRDALPVGDDWSTSWRRQTYGGFLLQLSGDQIDDETFLRICRETGRLSDLVTRLLERNRVDEAVAAMEDTNVHELLQLADIFVRYGHGEQAEPIVAQRAQSDTDVRLTEWLKQRARARGDLGAALSLAEKLFWQRPALPGYTELKELAISLDLWRDVRPKILARLEKEARFPLLTEIYLAENEIDQALGTVRQVGRHAIGNVWATTVYAGDSLKARVAQAAEGRRPNDAIELYLEMVHNLIEARGRDNYATAAAYLVRVRELYGRLGEEDYWNLFIAELREQHRRLRALQEELTRAGL